MTPTQNNTGPITEALQNAKDIFIMLGQNPSPDTIASGMTLFHTLNKPDKNVFIACPTKVDAAKINLPDVDQITHKIGNRNLVISLQVDSRESIDKVSYNLDEAGKVFNLVIQPRKGHPPLKSNDINFSHAGVQADVVIILGANRLEDLGFFYTNEPKLFTDAATISIGRNPAAKFAQNHYVDSSSASLSEVIYKFITESGSKLNAAAATSLLYGIDISTNYLQNSTVNANTFETVAGLMRAGGKRNQAPQESPASQPTSPSQTPVAGQVAQTPIPSQNIQNGSDIPQEWLTPKIYSGSAAKNN